MAYDKKQIFDKAMTAIEENKLSFVADLISFLPCSLQTFYTFFPKDSEDLECLKTKLDENKVTLKRSLRKKWAESENATLQLALYKLCADDEERRRLATNYNEHTGKDGGDIEISNRVQDHKVIFEKYSKDA